MNPISKAVIYLTTERSLEAIEMSVAGIELAPEEDKRRCVICNPVHYSPPMDVYFGWEDFLTLYQEGTKVCLCTEHWRSCPFRGAVSLSEDGVEGALTITKEEET